jgi:hypothetical protein
MPTIPSSFPDPQGAHPTYPPAMSRPLPSQPLVSYAQPTPLAVSRSSAMTRPRRRNGTPLAFEVLFALFGIHGVGWLMAGETLLGALMLAGSFLWLGVAGVAIAAGLGLCVAPINIGFLIFSAVRLSRRVQRDG